METHEQLEERAGGYKLVEFEPFKWDEEAIADAKAALEKDRHTFECGRPRGHWWRRRWVLLRHWWEWRFLAGIDNFRYWLAEKIHP